MKKEKKRNDQLYCYENYFLHLQIDRADTYFDCYHYNETSNETTKMQKQVIRIYL